jgi:hypothetical protein
MATLLDRFAPGWDAAIDSSSLDEMLLERIGRGKASTFDARETETARAKASDEVDRLLADRERKDREYRAAPGWSLEFVAGKEPLWPQGFDPLNVAVLAKGEVLHTRWIKLGNGSGALEVLGRPALTEAAGEHPLFQGVRRLLVTGIAEPSITEHGDSLVIRAEGVSAAIRGSVDLTGTKAVVRLP